MFDKDFIKKKINDWEYWEYTCHGKICGRDIEIVNLRLLKNKAIADIILTDYEDNTKERINKCEYPYINLLSL